MYLVDTSVWLDYIHGHDKQHVEFLDKLLGIPMAVGLNRLILMEILQGSTNQATFDRLQSYFSNQRLYQYKDATSYASAAKIYFDCRRQGITVRSSIDCLIAECAIENNVILLHNDKDYKHIARIVPTLQHKHFLNE